MAFAVIAPNKSGLGKRGAKITCYVLRATCLPVANLDP
jgi:hypothetical protein